MRHHNCKVDYNSSKDCHTFKYKPLVQYLFLYIQKDKISTVSTCIQVNTPHYTSTTTRKQSLGTRHLGPLAVKSLLDQKRYNWLKIQNTSYVWLKLQRWEISGFHCIHHVHIPCQVNTFIKIVHSKLQWTNIAPTAVTLNYCKGRNLHLNGHVLISTCSWEFRFAAK